MSFARDSCVWENAVRGETLVEEFGVGMGQATCTSDSFMILGYGVG